jgi:hypothetical protein
VQVIPQDVAQKWAQSPEQPAKQSATQESTQKFEQKIEQSKQELYCQHIYPFTSFLLLVIFFAENRLFIYINSLFINLQYCDGCSAA